MPVSYTSYCPGVKSVSAKSRTRICFAQAKYSVEKGGGEEEDLQVEREREEERGMRGGW